MPGQSQLSFAICSLLLSGRDFSSQARTPTNMQQLFVFDFFSATYKGKGVFSRMCRPRYLNKQTTFQGFLKFVAVLLHFHREERWVLLTICQISCVTDTDFKFLMVGLLGLFRSHQALSYSKNSVLSTSESSPALYDMGNGLFFCRTTGINSPTLCFNFNPPTIFAGSSA